MKFHPRLLNCANDHSGSGAPRWSGRRLNTCHGYATPLRLYQFFNDIGCVAELADEVPTEDDVDELLVDIVWEVGVEIELELVKEESDEDTVEIGVDDVMVDGMDELELVVSEPELGFDGWFA
jgi:hypothetical protein